MIEFANEDISNLSVSEGAAISEKASNKSIEIANRIIKEIGVDTRSNKLDEYLKNCCLVEVGVLLIETGSNALEKSGGPSIGEVIPLTINWARTLIEAGKFPEKSPEVSND